ncbi:MAG TPA: DALR anticodon-binding domain-containing protein, partial [Candidatus Nitrosotenuis sp.]|nr:DALR anticodon-binding domain-containing protein [Candidatus Nitrosotenuis sp.]
LQTTTGLTLQEAFRRAQGILANISDYTVNPKYFIAESETHLYEKLCKIAREAPQLLKIHDYHQLMAQLADIKQPLDQFFELKINDDNPQIRENRLALLQDLVRQTLIIADLSQLEGL